MRGLTDDTRVEQLMVALGRRVSRPCRVYLTGGASAVLHGWRPTTIDVDLKLLPDSDEMLRAISRLKDKLGINIELAAPDQFIPPVPGWETRSPFIRQEGKVSFYHYDFYGQALAKIERGHEKDLGDVREMVDRGLIEPPQILEMYERIEPVLYRYPSLSAASFRTAVERFVDGLDGNS
jgi:hypothetical protein